MIKKIIRILAGIVLTYNVLGLLALFLVYFKWFKETCKQCPQLDVYLLPLWAPLFIFSIFVCLNLFFFKEWARKLIIILFLINIFILGFTLLEKIPPEALDKLSSDTVAVSFNRMLTFIPISVYFFLILFFSLKKTKQAFYG